MGRLEGNQRPPEKDLETQKLELTDQGIQVLSEHGTDNQYQDMSREELIQTILELEERLDRLEKVFKDFRQKVMERI